MSQNKNGIRENITRYLRALETADYERIIELFTANAMIVSPLYGRQPATTFYRQLGQDTRQSAIEILDVYQGQNTQNWAAHFRYHWTLTNGSKTIFDCVDLFEFDAAGKIALLRIIYDTQDARPKLDAQRQNQN